MTPLQPTPYSKDYEITDAMFGAFRSPGGAPFFWKLTALLRVGYSVIFLLLLPPLAKSYGRMIVASIENDPSAVMRENLFIFPMGIVLMIAAISVNGIIRAAFYRTYFFDTPTEGLPLQFGADEWRQIIATLGYYAVAFGFSLVGGFIVGLLFGGIAFVAGNSAIIPTAILSVILMIALIVFIYWVMIRLSPAGALTALRGQTHVIAARHVSKNRVWALFGSILVAGLIGYVVYYILMTIGMLAGLSGLYSADMMSALTANDSERMVDIALDAVSQPGFKFGVVFAVIFMSAGAAFYQMLLAGPQAFFTRQWATAGTDVD